MRLTTAFLKVGATECFLVKQQLAAIKIMELVINRCFLKKAKSKMVDKIHQN